MRGNLPGEAPDLLDRPWPIGKMPGIAQINKIFIGMGDQTLVQDGKPADSESNMPIGRWSTLAPSAATAPATAPSARPPGRFLAGLLAGFGRGFFARLTGHLFASLARSLIARFVGYFIASPVRSFTSRLLARPPATTPPARPAVVSAPLPVAADSLSHVRQRP